MIDVFYSEIFDNIKCNTISLVRMLIDFLRKYHSLDLLQKNYFKKLIGARRAFIVSFYKFGHNRIGDKNGIFRKTRGMQLAVDKFPRPLGGV